MLRSQAEIRRRGAYFMLPETDIARIAALLIQRRGSEAERAARARIYYLRKQEPPAAESWERVLSILIATGRQSPE
jgi:hypothetical protein